MTELNLPPFYVGQKVVALKNSGDGSATKGNVYTVASCVTCKCGAWMVGILEIPAEFDSSYHNYCGGNHYEHKGAFCRHGMAKYFAPVQENFQSISLEKILEKETSLISAS